MVAISSHRKHGKTVCAYRRNQLRAKESWDVYFDQIIYFGTEESELISPKTFFIPSDNWPFIKDMAAEASRQQSDYVAIINADIVVTQPFRHIEGIMKASNMKAASSRRRDYKTRVLLDNDKGRDIFVCTPRVWGQVANNIPPNCRIGHQQWDSWMIAFLRVTLQNMFGEFTRIPCIYHPKHTGRNMPYADTIDISNSKYQISTFRNDPQLILDNPRSPNTLTTLQQ